MSEQDIGVWRRAVWLVLKVVALVVAALLTFGVYFILVGVLGSGFAVTGVVTLLCAAGEVVVYYVVRRRLRAGTWPASTDEVVNILSANRRRIPALTAVVVILALLVGVAAMALFLTWAFDPSPYLACTEAPDVAAENATNFSNLSSFVQPAIRRAIQADGDMVLITNEQAMAISRELAVNHRGTVYRCKVNRVV